MLEWERVNKVQTRQGTRLGVASDMMRMSCFREQQQHNLHFKCSQLAHRTTFGAFLTSSLFLFFSFFFCFFFLFFYFLESRNTNNTCKSELTSIFKHLSSTFHQQIITIYYAKHQENNGATLLRVKFRFWVRRMKVHANTQEHQIEAQKTEITMDRSDFFFLQILNTHIKVQRMKKMMEKGWRIIRNKDGQKWLKIEQNKPKMER